MSEMYELEPLAPFDERLAKVFLENHYAKVEIDQEPGEPFVEALDRISETVMKALVDHGLYDFPGKNGDVISNVQCDENFGWMYSVRVQKP